MKAMQAAAREAHKVKQAAADRIAMKGFVDDFDGDSDEEEMRAWIAEQKEENKSAADIAKEKYNAKMEQEKQEALADAAEETEFQRARARARMHKAKDLAALAEKTQIDKVYASYAKAMRNGDFKTIENMVKNVGISVNWEDTYGNTAIIAAAKYGLKVPIDHLLFLGADVNQENQFGRTPLIEACRGGYSNIVQHLLVDPDNPKELRAEANTKNRFGKTAADYAIAAGHGKKILPMINSAIAQQLKAAKVMGFEINEEDYKIATEFNKEDATRVKRVKKIVRKKKGTRISRMMKSLGLESSKAIARLHQLQDESARKIQGAVRTMFAKETMANRLRDIVMAAHRAFLKEKKKNIFIVKIQRGYRLKLARRYWRQRIERFQAATKMNSISRMFVARCFYLRKIELERALKKLDRCATLIQCQARQMKAKLRLSILIRRDESAKRIQRFSKIATAKRNARHKRWERDRHDVLNKLYKTAIEIKYVVIFDELKDELVAMKKIHKWSRALLFNWSQTIDWAAIRQLRNMEAVKIQNCAREWMSKRKLLILRKKRQKHLAGLPSVLEIRKLQGAGNNAYRVGSSHKYGYCTGCDCEKFRPPEPMKPLMCGCGHFITRHVIGYFRDPRQPDYYDVGKSRRKLMGRSFSAATGITENFDIVMKMSPKDLRKSLASTQSLPPPLEGGEDIKNPGDAARAQFKSEQAKLMKRKDKAKRAKLFDPIRMVGAMVPSWPTRKNPIMKAKRAKEAKEKVAITMKRNEQLELWKKQAEEYTGEKVSEKEFHRVSELYRERDESPKKQARVKGTTKGAILWNVPGETPLMEPSTGSPGKRTNHTLTLIEQLERDIKSTKDRAQRHRLNIIQIEKDEKRAKRDAKKAKKEYENHATVLLLQNRLEQDVEDTTHDKLIGLHIQTVDAQKEKLLKELNRISRKKYGLDEDDDDENVEVKVEVEVDDDGNKINNEGNRLAPTAMLESPPKTKRRSADALIGSLTEIAMTKHRGKEVTFSDLKKKRKDEIPGRRRDAGGIDDNGAGYISATPADVEDLNISSPKRRMKSKEGKTRRGANPANDRVSQKKKSRSKWDSAKGPNAPTADMVMSALKGMLKGIQNPERTKNRWIRTPETDSTREGKRRRRRNRRRGVSSDDEEYEDDFETMPILSPPVRSPDGSPVLGRRGVGNMAAAEEEDSFDMGKADFELDQRAETPLEHVAWRQSHAARAPVIYLHLVDNEGNGNKNSPDKNTTLHPLTIALRVGRTFVGRDGRSCDIMMDSTKNPKMMSKVHACFWVTRKGRKWVVECADCNSTNGTFVNGKRVLSSGRKRLSVGATILFGKRSRKKEQRSELLYVMTDDSAPPVNGGGGGGGGGSGGSGGSNRGSTATGYGGRSNYNIEAPPQSPLQKERRRRRKEDKSDSGLQSMNESNQQARRGSRRNHGDNGGGGDNAMLSLDDNIAETKDGNNSRRRPTADTSASMDFFGSKTTTEETGQDRRGRHQQFQQHQRSSSMTELDSLREPQQRMVPQRVTRRRSSLSRERQVVVSPGSIQDKQQHHEQQEQNFSNMMLELSEASEILRRPPTTPLKKRRSSLSRGGIRASIENPGMEKL